MSDIVVLQEIHTTLPKRLKHILCKHISEASQTAAFIRILKFNHHPSKIFSIKIQDYKHHDGKMYGRASDSETFPALLQWELFSTN